MGSLEVIDYRKKRTGRVNNGAAAKGIAAAPVSLYMNITGSEALYGIR